MSDRENPEALSGVVMGRIPSELMARNLLPFLADNRIHVVPPCVINDEEVAEALFIFDEGFSLALRG